jgi:hypothetical protein
VWAVEDCRHVTARLEHVPLGAGERVIRVPPALTGESPKASSPSCEALSRRALVRSTIRPARKRGYSRRAPTARVDLCAADPGGSDLPPTSMTSPMRQEPAEWEHEEEGQKEDVPAADDEHDSGEHKSP